MNTGTRSLRLIQFSALILFICGLVYAGGCTTPPGSNIDVKQSLIGGLSSHKIVAVDVTTKDLDFTPEQVRQLTGAIVDGLRKSARFDKIYDSATTNEHDADLKLSVRVEFVMGPNRYRVQSIESSLTLIDPSDDKTLAMVLVNSHSEWRLFGGHMTNAIAQLSDQIVNFTTKP